MSCLILKVKSKALERLSIQVSHVCKTTDGYTVLFASDGKVLTTNGETIYKKR